MRQPTYSDAAIAEYSVLEIAAQYLFFCVGGATLYFEHLLSNEFDNIEKHFQTLAEFPPVLCALTRSDPTTPSLVHILSRVF